MQKHNARIHNWYGFLVARYYHATNEVFER